MSEKGEQKVKFITDISEEFGHNVGNSLVAVRTALELAAGGRTFDETEDADFLRVLRTSKDELLARLDRILASEFDQSGDINRDVIRSFRELADKDWRNPQNLQNIIDEFERIRPEEKPQYPPPTPNVVE